MLQQCYSRMGLPVFFPHWIQVCFEHSVKSFPAHSRHFVLRWPCRGSLSWLCFSRYQLVDGTKVLQSAHSPGRRSSYCFLILFSVCIWILVTQREDRWTLASVMLCISKFNNWVWDNVRRNVSISFWDFIWLAPKVAMKQRTRVSGEPQGFRAEY